MKIQITVNIQTEGSLESIYHAEIESDGVNTLKIQRVLGAAIEMGFALLDAKFQSQLTEGEPWDGK